MIKNSQKQTGSALVVIVIIVVIALLSVLGYITWNNFFGPKNGNIAPGVNTTQQLSDSQVPISNKKSYTNKSMGISFEYPDSWVSLSCERSDDIQAVYFASDERGIGNGNDSLLCGGGTDFPPQMSFMIIPTSDNQELKAEFTTIQIDNVKVKKYVIITDENSIRPPGFEITYYSAILDNGKTAIFIYNKLPLSSSDTYDTSNETKQQFEDLVELTLQFL